AVLVAWAVWGGALPVLAGEPQPVIPPTGAARPTAESPDGAAIAELRALVRELSARLAVIEAKLDRLLEDRVAGDRAVPQAVSTDEWVPFAKGWRFRRTTLHHRSAGLTTALVEIERTGATPVDVVVFRATFYDGEGAIVGSGTGYAESFRPGEVRVVEFALDGELERAKTARLQVDFSG
ncbi:MAG TPA: hypothetical protein VF234_06970, partial [Limnochordia bacterium]